MKCPDCGAKISAKHYDPEFEWYECPSCEGAFTVEEMEASRAQQTRNKKGNSKGKAGGSGGKKRSHAGRANGKASTGDAEIRERIKSVPVAKGKKRRTEIEEDEQAVEDFTEQIVKNTIKQPSHTRHRDEMDTISVVNIWGDEIQDVYEELGVGIDEVNAQDKALIIWREIHHLQGVAAREQEVEHALCEDHE